MQGARVIGIAGSAAKCAWVVDELGFDACIDYKTEDVAARLKELAPKGVDVFFDNVGGELLDTVLRRLALRARVVLCGDISTYDVDTPPPPLHNVRYLMGKRARMEGFNTLDHWDHYHEAAAQLAEWLAEGKLEAREHVLDGLDRAPEALVRLFAGDHLGKLVVRVSRVARRLRLHLGEQLVRRRVELRRAGSSAARRPVATCPTRDARSGTSRLRPARSPPRRVRRAPR